MKKVYVAMERYMDECGTSHSVMGIFETEEDAQKVCDRYEKNNKHKHTCSYKVEDYKISNADKFIKDNFY